MHFLFRVIILACAFSGMALIPGIRVKSFGTAVVGALIFIVINFLFGFLVKGLLIVVTLGLALLALNFLLNLVLLWATDKLMEDIEIRGFGPLALGALILTVANHLASRFF